MTDGHYAKGSKTIMERQTLLVLTSVWALSSQLVGGSGMVFTRSWNWADDRLHHLLADQVNELEVFVIQYGVRVSNIVQNSWKLPKECIVCSLTSIASSEQIRSSPLKGEPSVPMMESTWQGQGHKTGTPGGTPGGKAEWSLSSHTWYRAQQCMFTAGPKERLMFWPMAMVGL